MGHRFAEIAFTDAVKAQQARQGMRVAPGRHADHASAPDRLGPREAEFITARDSFYMATVSESGWPYLQHRGGPPGFLRVLDAGTLGFADFRGNRQYVSTGNLSVDDRVALIMLDYAGRRRLKLLGHARLVDVAEDAGLVERLHPPGYVARAERAVLIAVEAFDWNCPQHITPRYSEADMEERTDDLRTRITELEAEIARLRTQAR
jgi:predicted pyridoxine 5'-phosphate oxidase superfamily flavin-nucleotide-binding protein